MVVRNHSRFLIKRNKQTNSIEPSNPKAHSSSRYNKLIHHKTVGVEPVAEGRPVVGVMKWRWDPRKPTTSYVGTSMSENALAAYPQQHQAHDPQEQVPPRSAHGCHSHSQSHPAQPEACDGKVEAASPTRSS
ncbi:hypothetical protein GH733_008777 [Mirounga leonina]|nr:hypothetical protein GH733_008777 [Mirounga leonina]